MAINVAHLPVSLCPKVECKASFTSSPQVAEVKVKVCGVTNVEDARMAASLGADFIGMILWPKAKRFVPPDVAAKISSAASEYGAKAVGVFVDECCTEILDVCQAANIHIAQLHGDASRNDYLDLSSKLELVYVVHANKDGEIQTSIPKANSVDWLLVDGLQGGSGERFDWNKLKVPNQSSNLGWILAGGLNPDNVNLAVKTLSPSVVDVSSGVTLPDKLRKDPLKVEAFIRAVKMT